MTTQNLSLGQNVDYTIDPNIPQSSQQSVNQINDATNQQVALINATKGGRRRKQLKSGGCYYGGDGSIIVTPLPLGATGANAQANNVAMSSLFANAESSSKYDSQVQTAGKRRRTRRLSTRRKHKRNTKIMRRRYKKTRKSRKSRR